MLSFIIIQKIIVMNMLKYIIFLLISITSSYLYYFIVSMMEQTPAIDLTLQKMLSWLNAHVFPSISSIQDIEGLNNCSAFLLLLSRLSPGIIERTEIIINPASDSEINSNRTLLSTVLHKMGLGSTINVILVVY
jgi:hypothetical protein